ncbi:redoxin domain-containing protein, partial [Vibrio sp. V29_P1S30P107]
MNTLTAGSSAPAFALPDQHGNTVSLSDFSDKKVLLY